MRISSGICTSALIAFSLAAICPAQDAATPAADDASQPLQAEPTVAAHSKVRIVRLSEVKGDVELDRNVGRGYESPMTNLPITEGVKLKTGTGVAEIEFEDNSTVRVGANSIVEFPRLELLPSGAKASAVHLLQGTVYVSLLNTKGNEFTLTFGKEKVSLPPDSHIRLELTADQASLAVLHGNALVEEPSGIATVSKNKTMTFHLASDSQPELAKSVAEAPLDSWDKNATQYHKSYANASSFGNSPYTYGINDMNYYGSFGSACGGSFWRPYFTNASWDPYGSGAWAYYPSAGYSWVSPYPWGWTPYHYGSWSFCEGVGWGWRPGGAYLGLANNSFASTLKRPRPPLHPPVIAQSTLVPVNMKAIPASGLGVHDTFVFRNNSAGMGVPRGGLGKLNSFSGQTVQHGAATTNVYFGGSQRAVVGEPRAANGGTAASSSRPVSAPSQSSNHSYSSGMQNRSMGASSHASPAPSGGGGGGGGVRH